MLDVGVRTDSFCGVRDQPVIGLKSCRRASLSARIRRVFGAAARVPSRSLVLASLLIAARACGPEPVRSELEVPVRPGPAGSTRNA
jgi:hypothetical protein